MSDSIPASHRDLIDGPILATLTTLMPDGQPQSSIVWCNSQDSYVLVNTARGRQKTRNMDRDPRVTILALDPNDPYRYVEVRGKVIDKTEEGAVEHIEALARLYTGKPGFYGHVSPAEQAARETRVTYKIKPTRVRTNG